MTTRTKNEVLIEISQKAESLAVSAKVAARATNEGFRAKHEKQASELLEQLEALKLELVEVSQ
ncbi:MAG: hypothetical protein ACPGSM_22100, partial [Thiolinea sp.]